MKELSTPAKCVLMAVATMMIGFSTLAACRGNDLKSKSNSVARGDSSLAYSALTYITWPAASFEKDDSPFVFGVLGKLSASHEKLLNPYIDGKKMVHARPVQVRRYTDASDVSKCHVLLIASTCPQPVVDRALKSAAGRSVLTIGETGGFAKSGGVMGVVKDGNESVLELNQQAARRQHLKIDVRLVNLSVLIQEH